MATVVCSTGTGVSSYVLHANFSVTPDPYPSGATITTSGKTVANVVNNSYVTIRANEVTLGSSYTYPVNVYKSTDGKNWTYVEYLQSTYVDVYVGSGTTYIRVGPATARQVSSTVICSTSTGVSSYVVHADYSVTPDPYPTGATVTSSGKTLANVVSGSTIVIRASETSLSSGYTFPVTVYKSSNGTSWSNLGNLTSGSSVTTTVSGTVYIRVGPATSSGYKYRVVVYGRQGDYGGTSETKYYPSSSTWYTSSTAANPTFSLSNVSLTSPTNYGLLGYAYNSTPTSGETLYTSSITVSSSTSGTVNNIHAVWGRYYYRVRYFLQDGSGESYYYPSAGSAFSVSGSPTFYLSNLPTPTRSGYEFVGWAYGSAPSAGETAYTSTIQLSVTSTDSSSPTICNIHAVWRQLNGWRVHAFGSGGSTSGGDTEYYYPSSNSFNYTSATTVTFNLNSLPLFQKDGYQLLGWAYGSAATVGETYYTTSITVDASASGATTNIHAVWVEKNKYRVHAFGNGGTYNGSSDVYLPSSSSWYMTTSTSPQFSIYHIPQFTNGRRFLRGWAYGSTPSAGETIYSSTIQLDASESGTVNNIHAVWGDAISHFYWMGNDSSDNASFVVGLRRIMTSDMWNSFADKVEELANACGASVSVSRVISGNKMMASQYNGAVDALASIKSILGGTTSIPSKVTANVTQIKASQFNGSGSLKSALNGLIDRYNS